MKLLNIKAGSWDDLILVCIQLSHLLLTCHGYEKYISTDFNMSQIVQNFDSECKYNHIVHCG